MDDKQNINTNNTSQGFISKSEEDKLRENMSMPDIEKLKLFTKMIRRNRALAKAKITHK